MTKWGRGWHARIVDWGRCAHNACRAIIPHLARAREPVETHFAAVMTDLHNQPDSILQQVERGETPRDALVCGARSPPHRAARPGGQFRSAVALRARHPMGL